ncbi:MAG: sugar phosphorylase [Anaerolineae bacterium]|nr:sugar phosphorylase [Anaerolineae bacterium]
MTPQYHGIFDKLVALYGPERGAACYQQLEDMLAAFRTRHAGLAPQAVAPSERVTECDIILITYGDSLYETGKPPLQTLHHFLREHLHGIVSSVHILPFFPFSSDDGFSIIDYTAVNPDLGTWEDIRNLGGDFDLMFDAVINHISAHSAWFEGFKAGDPAYHDFFIVVDPAADLSSVVRPRALPLLTPVETDRGTRHMWTTFSDDQIDLNFASEAVLLRVIDILLFYISQGMRFIRLDAIAYLWKKIGTSSIHLDETHTIVQLFRDIFDVAAPHVAIITETNVPHDENVSYFGDGTNEAQLVYQFTLPPLTLHAIATGDASVLSAWAAGLEKVSDSTTFFNFTASHDGIGVRPAEGILTNDDVWALVERTKAHGGDVSFKTDSDGSQSPYELNINFFDAISNPNINEPLDVQVNRFIVSQAIQLAFMGVPGIYIHSLLGSRNWNAGVAATGRLRTINREKLDKNTVRRELEDPHTLRHRVFEAYRHLITVRVTQKAFHPNGAQTVLQLHPVLFALLRTSPDGTEQIAAIHNVSGERITLDQNAVPLPGSAAYDDLVSGQHIAPGAPLVVAPYQVLWLKAR